MRSSTSAKPHRILVVDDDQIMRDVLTLMLGAEGHQVVPAHSGEQALEMLASTKKGAFDVVLTDMRMPGLHGVALANRLTHAMQGHGVLVGMSGSAADPKAAQAFDAFLQKPFSTAEFDAAVEQAVTFSMDAMRERGTTAAEAAPLDEAIFSRLAGMIPATQLGELYRLTLDDVQRRLQVMRAAAEAGDQVQCRAEAHAIKGSCGMVGAAELSALAAEVERGPLPGTSIFGEFDSACERLRRILRSRTA